MKNNIILKLLMSFIFSLLLAVPLFSQTIRISRNANQATLNRNFADALRNGGEIIFPRGRYVINLTRSQAIMSNNLTIRGANPAAGATTIGAQRPNNENNGTVLVVNIPSAFINLTNNVTNLTMRNLTWDGPGFTSDGGRPKRYDFRNIYYDFDGDSNTSRQIPFRRVMVRSQDPFSGLFENVTASRFGIRAIVLNRRLDETDITNRPPVQLPGRIIVRRCLFTPSSTAPASDNDAIGFDAGNDEYGPLLNYRNTLIENNEFVDCRIAISKSSNFTIRNNTFTLDQYRADVIHLEEFSRDITITGNTFDLRGGTDRELINLGGQQTCSDVTITNNSVVQTNNRRLERFVAGNGVVNITITGTTIQPRVNNRRYINFPGCGNQNIVTSPNPGINNTNIRVNNNNCTVPLADGTYIIRQGANRYLQALNNGTVNIVSRNTPPSSNDFRWRVNAEQVVSNNNYYTFQNVSTGNFLEVLRGPNQETWQAFGRTQIYRLGPNGQRPPNSAPTVRALAFDNYQGGLRPGGFGIFRQGQNFAITNGANGFRSDMRRQGNGMFVWVVNEGVPRQQNATNFSYQWRFIRSGSPKNIDDVANEITNDSPIYPNPASNIINITLKENTSWLIYNINGQTLKQGTETTTDVTNLQTGLYIVKFSDGKTSKFYKN